MTRVLLAGESWNTYSVHTKGASSYTTSSYTEGGAPLIGALRAAGHQVAYLPNHEAVEGFPFSVDELVSVCDVVLLSDLPADSLLLPNAVFVDGERRPDRTAVIGDFVASGGGLCMIGGYMSFSGFEGRARYAATRLADVLPVLMARHDDRVEAPDGVTPRLVADHDVIGGLPLPLPYFLGYNSVTARRGAKVILAAGDDPFLTLGSHGSGRTAAFASDCAPHWGSPDFLRWPGYGQFWSKLVSWLAGAPAGRHGATGGGEERER